MTIKSDFKGLKDWVEIFKTGQHPGKGDLAAHTFSADDLDEVVANLDPDHPVPHVITHEELYSPFAYAQGVELKREGDSLYVRSDKINPDFERLIENGNLSNRSIRILKTDKGFELGHIAWLGAEPPAVEGLAPVSFSSGAAGTVFSVGKPPAQSKSTQGDDDMGEFTRADIDAAVAKAKKAAEAKGKADAEAAFQQEKTALEAQLVAEKKLKAKGEWDGKVKALIAEGKLTPAQAEGLSEFALALPEATLEFSRGEGDSKQTVKTATQEWFGNFLRAMPKQVPMKKDARVDPAHDAADWVHDPEKVAAKAVEYQAEMSAKGIEVNVVDAVNHVTAQGDQ